MDETYNEIIIEMFRDKNEFKKILDDLEYNEKIKLIKKIIRKKKNRDYYLKNKMKINMKNKEYYYDNKEEIFEKNKEYRKNYYLMKKERLNTIKEEDEKKEE